MNNTRRIILATASALTPDLTPQSADVSGENLSVYTFPNQSFGAAHANRLIIVGLAFRSGTAVTVSSVTIGGVAATVDVEARNTSNGVSSAVICHAAVPTGATGDVVLTLSAAAVRAGCVTYRTTRYAAAIPTKTGTATNSTPPGAMSPSLSAPDTGFAIGAAYSGGGTNHLITTASRNIAGTGGTHTITVDCQDGTSSWTAGLDEDTDNVMEASVAGPMAAASAGWKYP